MSRQTKPRTEGATGFVYLVSSPGGLFKIGQSSNPAARLPQLGPPIAGLAMRHTIQSTMYAELERWLHQAFSHRRVRSEWFRLTPDEVDLLCGVGQANAISDLPDSLLLLRARNETTGFRWGGEPGELPVKINKQLTFKVDREMWATMSRLRIAMTRSIGINITTTRLVQLAVQAVAKKHPEGEKTSKGGKK